MARAVSQARTFMHSRFCAAAVRNMALLLTLLWNWLITRNEPSFFRDSSPVKRKHQRECQMSYLINSGVCQTMSVCQALWLLPVS